MGMYVFVCKLLYRLFFHHVHFIFKVLATLLQYMFDLCKGNYGEELGEQEITGKEQAKCSQVKSYLPDSGCIIRAPGRRQVIPVYRGNNNYKALEPHTNIYQ